MGTRIAANEATIKTASVEVRALTISGRQVTLSMFRQLQEEQVVDEETLTLKGPVWGKVNYFWGDNANFSESSLPLHVVWQKGDELRRAIVVKDLRFGFWSRASTVFEDRALAHQLLLLTEGRSELRIEDLRAMRFVSTIEGRKTRTEMGYGSDVGRAISHLVSRLETGARDEPPSEYGQRAYECIRDYANQLCQETSADEAGASAAATARRLNEAEATWATLYQSLGDLDQLFIAT